MQKSGWGRIINIAGTVGWQPGSTAMAVGLSNAAVINWTKSMSLQYAADGIFVTTVAPGSIETPASSQPTAGSGNKESDPRRAIEKCECEISRFGALAVPKRLPWWFF
jgi:NAD(P)-dependent dehydrogenase (short-subunit alcohol dehydrogenase family)